MAITAMHLGRPPAITENMEGDVEGTPFGKLIDLLLHRRWPLPRTS